MTKRYNSKTGKGWKGESKRHSLARQGIKTGQKISPRVKAMLKKNPKLKNKTYKQLQKSGVFLKAKGDVDGDKVLNSKDCRPLNPKMHKDERVKEIEFDPSVEEPTKTQTFVGKTKAFVGKEARIGKEFASKKLADFKKYRKTKKLKTLDEVSHPLVRNLEKQQRRVDTIKTQIAETNNEENEEKLFNELETEQEQLRDVEEKITELNLEDLSDRQLKTLAIRHKDDSIFGTTNKFTKELVRRIVAKKNIETELQNARKGQASGSLLNDIFN